MSLTLKILTIIFSNRQLQKIFLGIAHHWAEDTQTKVDDWVVAGLEKMTDITVEHNESIPDGNLFLGNDDLTAIKTDRVVVQHEIAKQQMPVKKKKKGPPR